MDENPELAKELVHLARVALQGDKRQVEALIRRLAKKVRTSNASLAGELGSLLATSTPPTMNATRSAMGIVPVDGESRLDLLRIEYPDFSLEDPVLLPSVARRVEQVLSERRHVDGLLEVGLEPSRTLLFTGPPGVGKTLTAKWIAKELRQPLLTLDLASVMSSFLGRTGANVRAVLDYAKATDGVLFLDEFDAVAKRRADDTEVGELKRLVTVLLQEIDQWPADRLLIAATNHGELLDPAVWRRFDMIIEFPLPSSTGLEDLALRQLGTSAGDSWARALAIMMNGHSFSDLARLIRTVRRQAVVYDEPIEARLQDLLRDKAATLSKSDLKAVAVQLEMAGIAQRTISDLTGLSRDTIRKARANREVSDG